MCRMVLVRCVLHWTIYLAISHAIFGGETTCSWTVHSPRFCRMMVEIKDFASLSAILDESKIYLGGLEQYI